MPMNTLDFVDIHGRVVGRITNVDVPVVTTSDNACPKCGVEIQVGMFPFCPHGHGAQHVVADDIPGGMMVENGFAEPIKVYSHSEHRRLLAAEGLEIRAKNAGEHDKICPRWDTVDLDAAKALLERGPQARREKRARWANRFTGEPPSAPITVTDGDTFTGKDLNAD